MIFSGVLTETVYLKLKKELLVTPQPLNNVWELFSHMATGWAFGQVGSGKKLVWAISQKL